MSLVFKKGHKHKRPESFSWTNWLWFLWSGKLNQGGGKKSLDLRHNILQDSIQYYILPVLTILTQSDCKKRLMKEPIDVSLTHGKILHSFPLEEGQETCIFRWYLNTFYALFFVYMCLIYVSILKSIFMKLLHNYLHVQSYYIFP